MVTPGQRKIYALKMTLGTLMGIAVLYVACLAMGLPADASVFGSFAGVIGVAMGGFSWANGREHRPS